MCTKDNALFQVTVSSENQRISEERNGLQQSRIVKPKTQALLVVQAIQYAPLCHGASQDHPNWVQEGSEPSAAIGFDPFYFPLAEL